ncbi:MAG: hypothetical protein IJ484_04865 [Oscillospiraceae bacterium]|nr:hypothetical protein [Oscillospiraceae bacterium]
MHESPMLLEQLLEETRRGNRLKQRQLMASYLILVALLFLAAAAVALFLSLRSSITQLTDTLASLQVLADQLAVADIDGLSEAIRTLGTQLSGVDVDGLNRAAAELGEAAGNLNEFSDALKSFRLFG